jgi:conjugal transfer pilus assembly protein TraW
MNNYQLCIKIWAGKMWFSTMLFILFYLPIAFAKDFGTQSTTFPIKEEGFLSMIQRRLASIDITAHQKKMSEVVTKSVEEPKAVANITKASKTTTHYFDPSYSLDHDVILPSGELLYTAGTRVNPLDHLSWTGKMVFIDARDQSQVRWLREHHFKQTLKHEDSSLNKELQFVTEIKDQDDDKIILVGGKPLQLAKDINYQVYFDQFAELSNRFSIIHVPAIVEQEDKKLKITQINIGD